MQARINTLPFLFSLFIVGLVACTSETSTRVSTSPPAKQQVEPEQTPPPSSQPGKTVLTDQVASQNQAAPKREVPASPAELKQLHRQELHKHAAKPHGRMASPGVLAESTANIRIVTEPLDRENYAHFDDNPVKRVAEHPVSTFSIDVDTGAYSNIRRIINAGHLPRKDAVRVEEMINYFSYHYPAPASRSTPFLVTTELGPTPWNTDTRLLHIGIKGYDLSREKLPAANLVFLVDVSGSMNSANKLGLLKQSLKLLTKQLRPEDRISLVVYAGASGIVLQPTPGDDQIKIGLALDQLHAGGSTNGASGIRLAYQVARSAWIKGGINRVLLATDGDFNVGTVSHEALMDLIEQQRKSGITLTTLGFGSGNYNDKLMEQLADAGNGNYAYIDSLNEAQKVLVDEMGSTLHTIAEDVKIQIEFNPATVAEYRLVGYENRMLQREDFNNDKVDAGDIGAGHTVTAIYELALTGKRGQLVDPLRYGSQELRDHAKYSKEVALVRLRYKQPDAHTSKLIEQPVHTTSMIDKLERTSLRFRFAAAVAGYGQLLRGGRYLHSYNYDEVIKLARNARGNDHYGYRGEFIKLVNLTNSLSVNNASARR